MLILTSNGLSSEKLLAETPKYTREKHTAVIVTTASVGYKEKDWHIPRITEELQTLGLSVSFIDLEFESPQKLASFDVIVINGGNPFFLLKHIKKWNMDGLFGDYTASKIIIGISAGSIVLQNSINLIAMYSPEMNENVGLRDLTGLGLLQCEILPHYSRFISKYDRFEERATEYERDHNITLFRLDDGQALFAVGNNIYTV